MVASVNGEDRGERRASPLAPIFFRPKHAHHSWLTWIRCQHTGCARVEECIPQGKHRCSAISSSASRSPDSISAELPLEHQLNLARTDMAVLEVSTAPPEHVLAPVSGTTAITHLSSAQDEMRLFRSRFRGRTDAFDTSWFSSKTKNWVSPKNVAKSDLRLVY